MKCLSGVLALYILTPVFSWIHRCPPTENLAPLCTCDVPYSSHVKIVCNHLNHAHGLSKQLPALNNYVVDELVIENSGQLDMVDGLFQNINIHRLLFKNSNFRILSLFSSLNGTQHTLEELKFDDCNVIRWVRSTGTDFSFLKTVEYWNVNLIPILTPEDFADYPSRIEKLTIKFCKITRLEKSALKEFTSLKYLYLSYNRLSSISRNALSPNLPRLMTLDLSDNPLETLPNDMFKQMPRLENLNLKNTKLMALHQEIFLPVWHQLEIVNFKGVWLNCDCNSTWLITIDWEKLGGYDPSCFGFFKTIQEITRQELCPKENQE